MFICEQAKWAKGSHFIDQAFMLIKILADPSGH